MAHATVHQSASKTDNTSGRGAVRRSRAARRLCRACAVIEALEDRRLLTTTPFISEFLAINDTGLKDEDGDRSDWIEIANPLPADVSLEGFFLTDSKNDLMQWRIPAVTLGPGGYITIFASGKDRRDPTGGKNLHTNFQLDGSGEYLALVMPDGRTIASQFDPYPEQRPDMSYGIVTDATTTSLIGTRWLTRLRVPTDANLGDWTSVNFNDSLWFPPRLTGIGYDIDTAPPQVSGFTVRMVDVAGGSPGPISTAEAIVGTPFPSNFTKQADVTKTYSVINIGQWGNFPNDLPLPTGVMGEEQYVLKITANVTIPAGTWTIDVGSDDGMKLTIPGVTFTSRYNNSGAANSDTIVFQGWRGHDHTGGTFTVGPGGLSTTLTLIFFEDGGGDDVELSIASGAKNAFDSSFMLLSDGVLPGWSVKTASDAPAIDYTPLLGSNVQSVMLNKNATALMRLRLGNVDNPADFDAIRLRIKYDDGFVAWLNGVKIAQRNAPDTLAWNSAATASRPDTDAVIYEDIDIALPPGLLQAGNGTNVLAIQGLNRSAADLDFLIYPELLGLHIISSSDRYFTRPTPGAGNDRNAIGEVVADTKFSHDRGFYSAPFQLTISTATAGAQIRYTTDGSAPTATTGTIYAGPITINRTTILRAAAFKPGALSSNVDTQTYVFLDDVIRQSPAGTAPTNGAWPPPGTYGPYNQVIDYGMDPDVVNNLLYMNTIKGDLLSIPTISLVMNLNDLFNPSSDYNVGGIYVNAWGDGRVWERPGSVELINPDGSRGFQIDAGIRIRGGFSRSPDNPKHAFRLFFRNEYGAGKLKFPLFGDKGTDTFDSIDLRTFQNYSWSFGGDPRGVFVRDQFNRDVQLAMGHPGERGEYYHLYINGQYWGLYNTCERPEADYAASYFGGSPEDYDVIKHGGIYATDGNMLAWTDLWNQLRGDISNNDNYLRVQGLNPDGTRNPNYPVLLDVDNLIDYMLIIFYGGNLDAPLSAFMNNEGPNNFYAIRNRNGDQGFKFFIHDAEHTLLNVNEDRTGPFNTISPDPNTALYRSNPQYMFQLLCANAEFRLRVADRVRKWFFNDGVLTPANALAIFNNRVAQIDRAVVAESARWGDSKRPTSPLTRQDWLNEVNNIRNNFLPFRTGVVFNQLKADKLYTDLGAPNFGKHGGLVPGGYLLTIANPNTAGTIYYTLDGSDPRKFGGALSPSAIRYTAAIPINGTVTVSARVYNGAEWSAITQATFYRDLGGLKISEIMYNPAPPAGGPYLQQDFEYIELQNTGDSEIDLTNVSFTAGIDYAFPAGRKLAPGAYFVLVKNAEAFQSRYPGVTVDGQFAGGTLDNGGERLVLTGPGGVLLDFSYNDNWYSITDGDGYSLVLTNPSSTTAQPGDKSSWRASQKLHGSPGAADIGWAPGSVIINEVMSHTDDPLGDWIELHNTTDADINIGGWFLSDDKLDRRRFRIPDGTILPARGYITFNYAQHFGNPAASGFITAFAFSELGDDAILTSSDGDNLGGYRDDVDFGASANEIPFGRYQRTTGGLDFVALSAPTYNAPNALPLVGPAVISEIMYNPGATGQEWIELVNLTGSALPLYDPLHPNNTWRFTEGVSFVFPVDARLPAFGYGLVVGIDPAQFRSTYAIPENVPVWGPWTGVLDNAGEVLKLAKPGAPELDGFVPMITVDQVNYKNAPPWPEAANGTGASMMRRTLNAYGNDAGNWVAGPVGGTPGQPFVIPTPPSDLVGAGITGNLIRLTWTDNSDNEKGFRIERSADGINFTLVGTTAANVNTYDDGTGLNPGTFYVYRVQAYNNAGASVYTNTFNVATTLVQTVDLIRAGDVWRYNEARKDPGANWTTLNYNDQTADWKSGAGLLAWEDGPLPEPIRTWLDRGPTGSFTAAYYFRFKFFLDVDPSAITSTELRTIVDDGALVYLNGNPSPIYKLNLEPGATYQSWATGGVGDATWSNPVNVPSSRFVRGWNILAAEVHQISSTSSDVVWGATLKATFVQQPVMADIVDVSPKIRTAPVASMTISFNDAVTGFDLSDLRLTRDGGPNLLTAAQTLTTSDNRSWTLNNLASLTSVPGEYRLYLSANGSGVNGSSAGRFLGADAFETFRVTPSSIQGTPLNDNYHVRLNGSMLEFFNTLPPIGSPAYSIPVSQITQFNVDGGSGNDLLEVGNALPVPLAYVGGSGLDTLSLLNGNHTLGHDLGSVSVETLLTKGQARATLATSQQFQNLIIDEAGLVRLLGNGLGTLRTAAINLGQQGTLDLVDNTLVVQATSSTAASVLAQVRDAVARARNGGQSGVPWSGAGITTSAADANKGLAVVQYTGRGGANLSALGLDANSIVAGYTWNGDCDLNGRIDADDYFRIDKGFFQASRGTAVDRIYANGDFNYDGAIDIQDYILIDSAFMAQNAASGGSGGGNTTALADSPAPADEPPASQRARAALIEPPPTPVPLSPAQPDQDDAPATADSPLVASAIDGITRTLFSEQPIL